MLKKVSILEKLNGVRAEPFRLFLLLWVSIYYLDLAEHWRNIIESGLVLGLILGQILIPSKKYFPLFTLLVLQIFLAQKLPILANHNLIMFFGNFLIAAHILWPQKIKPQMLARSFILCLAVVYFWAGFHKINLDFIYGGKGCANLMLKDILWDFLNKEQIDLIGFSIWPGLVTILSELLISSLLFWRSLFFMGSMLLLLFHSVVILSGIVDFAFVPLVVLIYASLVFLEEKKYEKYNRFITNVSIIFIVICLFSSLGFIFPQLVKEKYIHFSQLLAWWSLATLLAWHLIKNRSQIKKKSSLQNKGSLFLKAVFPVLFFILGSTSYIGLNTTRNFSMFSNLRTEGNEWNHFLVPESIRIFHYQDEIYWVQKVDKKLMYSFRENPMLKTGLVSFEIQRLYQVWRKRSQWPKHFIVKRASDGKIADVRDLVPESSEISPLSLKLMYFRPIRYGLGAECMW